MSDFNLKELQNDLESNKEQAKKDYDSSTGQIGGLLKYTGSFVMKARTNKYYKEGEKNPKEYPTITQDKYKGYHINVLCEIVSPTKNVSNGITAYIRFPLMSKNPDENKRKGAANICKSHMLAFSTKEVSDSMKFEMEWLQENIFGEFKEDKKKKTFELIRETKLNEKVFIEFIGDVDLNGKPVLKATKVRKATPDDKSIEGAILSADSGETVVPDSKDAKPQFNKDNTSGSASNKAVDDF